MNKKNKKVDDDVELHSVLNKIYSDDTFARQFGDLLFPTSISLSQGEKVSELVRKVAPQNILELGLGYGIASLWIELGKSPTAKHTIVDPYVLAPKTSPLYKIFKSRKNLELHFDRFSQQYLATQMEEGNKFDFIFLDADLKFDGMMADMYFITRVLRQGGRLMVRNMWNPSVRKAVMFLVRNLPYQIEGIPLSDEQFIKTMPFFWRTSTRTTIKAWRFRCFEAERVRH